MPLSSLVKIERFADLIGFEEVCWRMGNTSTSLKELSIF